MTIKVIFSKRGFYSPLFGRMGHGDKFRGTVYELPDAFKEPGMLPKSVQILDEDAIEEALEENDQKKPIKPPVLDAEGLKKATAGAGKRNAAQSAQMRTAPPRKVN